MNWRDTPLIDSTPEDIDEKLRDILLSRTMGQYMRDENGDFIPVDWAGSPVIEQYIDEIKELFKP